MENITLAGTVLRSERKRKAATVEKIGPLVLKDGTEHNSREKQETEDEKGRERETDLSFSPVSVV